MVFFLHVDPPEFCFSFFSAFSPVRGALGIDGILELRLPFFPEVHLHLGVLFDFFGLLWGWRFPGFGSLSVPPLRFAQPFPPFFVLGSDLCFV